MNDDPTPLTDEELSAAALKVKKEIAKAQTAQA